MRRVALLGAFALLLPAPVSIASAPPTRVGSYIVVLRASVASPATVAAAQGSVYGFQAQFVYNHALKGYAARLSDDAVSRLLSDPNVAYIDRDLTSSIAQIESSQVQSNGVLRVDGDESSTVSGDGSGSVPINVAILDDGIDSTHPDLNVVGGVSCRGPKKRGGNHGTEIAGLIGAIDNDFGTVGVAPGARLWDVRAFDHKGFAPKSAVICGLDWVTGTRTDADPANDIAVANLSFHGSAVNDTASCPASKDAYHAALCNALAAGVSIVAAAGNDSIDFQNSVPATWDEVLTATAMADRDGEPGGLGGQFVCLPSEFDDTPATFSSFATLAADQAHTVAAPGVCFLSTFPNNQYAIVTGTSFATPLVAGTVALCIWSGPCAGLTPQQITEKIVGDATAYNAANPDYGYTGDPQHSPDPNKYYGFLVRAALY